MVLIGLHNVGYEFVFGDLVVNSNQQCLVRGKNRK